MPGWVRGLGCSRTFVRSAPVLAKSLAKKPNLPGAGLLKRLGMAKQPVRNQRPIGTSRASPFRFTSRGHTSWSARSLEVRVAVSVYKPRSHELVCPKRLEVRPPARKRTALTAFGLRAGCFARPVGNASAAVVAALKRGLPMPLESCTKSRRNCASVAPGSAGSKCEFSTHRWPSPQVTLGAQPTAQPATRGDSRFALPSVGHWPR